MYQLSGLGYQEVIQRYAPWSFDGYDGSYREQGPVIVTEMPSRAALCVARMVDRQLHVWTKAGRSKPAEKAHGFLRERSAFALLEGETMVFWFVYPKLLGELGERRCILLALDTVCGFIQPFYLAHFANKWGLEVATQTTFASFDEFERHIAETNLDGRWTVQFESGKRVLVTKNQ